MAREAEIGGMWPQAKPCLEPLEAGKVMGGIPPRASGGTVAPMTRAFGFWPPEL